MFIKLCGEVMPKSAKNIAVVAVISLIVSVAVVYASNNIDAVEDAIG